MRTFFLFIGSLVVYSSCSTTKKTAHISKTFVDSVAVSTVDSIGVKKSTVMIVDVDSFDHSSIITIDFDTADNNGTVTETTIAGNVIKSHNRIKWAQIQTKDYGKTTHAETSIASDSGNVKKNTNIELQKKEVTKDIEKIKTYSMPWYFWIILLIGGLTIAYLILKRYKIL